MNKVLGRKLLFKIWFGYFFLFGNSESKGFSGFADLLKYNAKFSLVGLPFAGTCCTDLEITSTISRDESRWKGRISYDNNIDLSGIYKYSEVHGHKGKNAA